MPALPNPHAAAAILLALMMFYAFATGRVRVEIISLLTVGVIALGLYFFPMPGSSPKDGLIMAFEGFGHHALITICALMILGRGLVVTGALNPAARMLTTVSRYNKSLGLLVTLVMAFGMSMLVNDTPVLVLLLPILVKLAHDGGLAASKSLIPANSAILIGGMATTIGTSTNLLVVSIATDLGLKPMGLFHFTGIVLAAGAIALPYIWLVMPRLLPDNSPEAGHPPRRYWATLRFEQASPSVGKSLAKLRAHLPKDIEFKPGEPDLITAGMRLEISGAQEFHHRSGAPAWRHRRAALAGRTSARRSRQRTRRHIDCRSDHRTRLAAQRADVADCRPARRRDYRHRSGAQDLRFPAHPRHSGADERGRCAAGHGHAVQFAAVCRQ